MSDMDGIEVVWGSDDDNDGGDDDDGDVEWELIDEATNTVTDLTSSNFQVKLVNVGMFGDKSVAEFIDNETGYCLMNLKRVKVVKTDELEDVLVLSPTVPSEEGEGASGGGLTDIEVVKLALGNFDLDFANARKAEEKSLLAAAEKGRNVEEGGERGEGGVESARRRRTGLVPRRVAQRTRTSGKKIRNVMTCQKCGYSTSKLDSMRQHLVIHSEKKIFKCEICSYTNLYYNAIKRHMKSHTGDKLYKCTICDFSSIHWGSTDRHIRTHTRLKPYKCGECEYSSHERYRLADHMRVHSGEKPYSCDKCDYVCSNYGSMYSHKKRHTGEKPFKCDECKYRCLTKQELKFHSVVHTKYTPFKCEQCEYSTARKTNLKRHMKVHNNKGKPFACDLCDFSCYQHIHLISHFRIHPKKMVKS